MAKDDYYTLVAKILVYLYKKYKQKEIEKDYISPLTKDFSVKKTINGNCINDIEISGMTLENTIDQVLNDVFRSDRTYFVEKMMIVNEKEILKVFEK